VGLVSPVFPIQLFQPIAYPNTLTATNVALLTQPGTTYPAANGALQITTQPKQSVAVNAVFNWDAPPFLTPSLTFINAATMNLQSNNGASSTGLLNQILMVYINNADNGNDVTVYFADTGMFVTCEAGTSGYFPVLTNILICTVFNGSEGTGTTLGDPSLTQTTQILFCNFAIPGFATQSRPVTTLQFSNEVVITSMGVVELLFPQPPAFEFMSIELYALTGEANTSGNCFVSWGIGTVGNPGSLIYANRNAFIATTSGQQFVFQPYISRLSTEAAPLIVPAFNGGINVQCTQLQNLIAVTAFINLTYNVM
jgi:hypothetical protein